MHLYKLGCFGLHEVHRKVQARNVPLRCQRHEGLHQEGHVLHEPRLHLRPACLLVLDCPVGPRWGCGGAQRLNSELKFNA